MANNTAEFTTCVQSNGELTDYALVVDMHKSFELDGSISLMVNGMRVLDRVETSAINSFWCMLMQLHREIVHSGGYTLYLPGRSVLFGVELDGRDYILRVGLPSCWQNSTHVSADVFDSALWSAGTTFLDWLIRYSPVKSKRIYKAFRTEYIL